MADLVLDIDRALRARNAGELRALLPKAQDAYRAAHRKERQLRRECEEAYNRHMKKRLCKDHQDAHELVKNLRQRLAYMVR